MKSHLSRWRNNKLFTFSWVNYSLIHDCDWWIRLVKLMHMGVVWTSRDKTLGFYWSLKFGQLPTHPSVFSPWKSCHAPNFRIHPPIPSNKWQCHAWRLKSVVEYRKWRHRIFTNFVHFTLTDLCHMTSLSRSITSLVCKGAPTYLWPPFGMGYRWRYS